MGVIVSGYENYGKKNEVNLAATPSTLLKSGETWLIIVAILIPVLAGFTQWLSGKISQNMMKSRNGDKKQEENAMAQQMNTMMNVMPIMSVFLCFSMQIVLGMYWIVSAVVRIVQQIVINKVLDKKPIDVLVEENMKKAAKKNADYVFLKYIFDSQTEADKKASFTPEELKEASRRGLIDRHVYALGGMNIDTIRMAKDLGFGGVVISGDLWNRFNIHQELDFQALINHFSKLRKAVG